MTIPIGINIIPVNAERILDAGRLAEGLGFDSVWLGEHIVVPAVVESAYLSGVNTQPFDPDSPFLDPLLVLSHIAAVTTRIRLGVGIYLLPARHPVLTAKAFATLDRLSRGRLDLGFGVGWMREELEMLGIDWRTRGRRAEDALACIETLLSEHRPSYESEFFTIPVVGFEPKPLRSPIRSRIIAGGYSGAAYERAARHDGWYGPLHHLDPVTNAAGEGWNIDAVRVFTTGLRRKREAAGLDPTAYDIIGYARPAPSRSDLEQLAAAGIDRAVANLWPSVDNKQVGISDDLEPLEVYADRLGLRTPVLP